MFIEDNKLIIYEWTKYKVISLQSNLCPSDFNLIGEYFNKDVGTLYFKNTIGNFLFKKILLQIHSRKLTFSDYYSLVEIINNYIFNLSFDYNRKGALSIFRNAKKKSDIPYHIFLLIYHSLTSKHNETNLLVQFDFINHNPVQKLDSFETINDITEIDDISNYDLSDIFSSSSEFIESNNSNNKLAKKLNINGNNYLPSKINSIENDFSYDTNENQFIKYYFSFIVDLLTKFEFFFKNDPDFMDFDLLNNTIQLKKRINQSLSNSFLKNVSNLTYLNTNSPILHKKEGYRQFFNSYIHIKSLPEITLSEKFSELIESKSIDVLYENYCFFKIASILSDLYNQSLKKLKFKVMKNEFSKTLEKKSHSNYFEFENDYYPKVRLHYNKNYSPKDKQSYSNPYDPDISLEIYENNELSAIYIFDAKFKLTINGEDEDSKQYFKEDDISKMHTYKDAIIKTVGAFVLYPGTETAIYKDLRESNFKYCGVGAFPLRPNVFDDESNIKKILHTVLSQFIPV